MNGGGRSASTSPPEMMRCPRLGLENCTWNLEVRERPHEAAREERPAADPQRCGVLSTHHISITQTRSNTPSRMTNSSREIAPAFSVTVTASRRRCDIAEDALRGPQVARRQRFWARPGCIPPVDRSLLGLQPRRQSGDAGRCVSLLLRLSGVLGAAAAPGRRLLHLLLLRNREVPSEAD